MGLILYVKLDAGMRGFTSVTRWDTSLVLKLAAGIHGVVSR